MENLQIGTRVKINFGMGRTVTGTVADITTNRWGKTAVVFTDNGDEEYVTSVVKSGTGYEIGCHII